MRKLAPSSESDPTRTWPLKSLIAMVGLCPIADSKPVAKARTVNRLIPESIRYLAVNELASGIGTWLPTSTSPLPGELLFCMVPYLSIYFFRHDIKMQFQFIMEFNQPSACSNQWDAKISLPGFELAIGPQRAPTENDLCRE